MAIIGEFRSLTLHGEPFTLNEKDKILEYIQGCTDKQFESLITKELPSATPQQLITLKKQIIQQRSEKGKD